MKVLLAVLVLVYPLITVASPSKRELSLNDADHKGNRLFKRKGSKKSKGKKSGKKSDDYYPEEPVYYPEEPVYHPQEPVYHPQEPVYYSQEPIIQTPVTIYIQSPSIPTEATIYETKTSTHAEAVETTESYSETSSEESPSSIPYDDSILQPPVVDVASAQELGMPEPNVPDLDTVSGTVILSGELALYVLLFLGIM